MSYKGLIFDLDGVIVDTANYHFEAWKFLGKNFNYELSHEQNENLKGISRIESLEKILVWANHTNYTADEFNQWLIEKNDHYLELISNMNPSELLPGTKEFIIQAKEKGFKIALGSASKNSTIILEKTGIIHLFDVIVDGNLVTKSKPHPEVFLKGAELLNLKPEECIVFEDALSGIEAAKKANMLAIGLGKKEVLINANECFLSFNEINLEKISKTV